MANGKIVREDRPASSPVAGLARATCGVVVGLGVGAAINAGVPEETAQELGGQIELVCVGVVVPLLSYAGKRLRDAGNPFGALF